MKPSGAPDWSAIFERHPELKPPGYEETVEAMRAQQDQPKQKKSRKR